MDFYQGLKVKTHKCSGTKNILNQKQNINKEKSWERERERETMIGICV